MDTETVSEDNNDKSDPTRSRMSQVDIALVRTLRDVLGELLTEQRALVEQLIEQQGKTTPGTTTTPTKEAADAIDKYRKLQRALGRTK